MYIDEIYSVEEIEALQSSVWWVACNNTPFLIRMASHGNSLLLNISNLSTLWATKYDEHELMQQKRKYSKSLQVENYQQLLHLFSQILSRPDEKTIYEITERKSGLLRLDIRKNIQVYLFVWKFDLCKLLYDPVRLVCSQLVNPMVKVIQSQENRIDSLRKKTKMIEDELMKKMGESQKKMYKSVLVEDEQVLKSYIEPLTSEQKRLTVLDLKFTAETKIILQQLHPKREQPQQKTKTQQLSKQIKKNSYAQRQQKQVTARTNNQLMNELRVSKEQSDCKKKKKNIDFL